MSIDALFEPVQLGSLSLNNRVVMAPMTRQQAPSYVPTDAMCDYYRRRARGGVGLILTEGTLVGHEAASGYPDVPNFHGEQALAGWSKVLDAVHAEGGKLAPQLWHTGSVRQLGMPPNREVPGVGPSPVVHPYLPEGDVPRGLSLREVEAIVQAFADAAGAACRLGFDAVEVHGAHGYLVDQFFWQRTNQRTDKYGGDAQQRTRFAAEIISEIRRQVPVDFPVILRFSQWKLGAYRDRMFDSPAALEAWLGPLLDAGVDVFHCSTRRYFEAEFEGSELNLAGWTKKLTGKPTITVGSVGLDNDFFRTNTGQSAGVAGLQPLLQRLERGEFDLVAVGRALLADPDWLTKWRDGREDEVIAFEPRHKDEYF